MCCLSGKAAARANRPELKKLHEDTLRAQKRLGLGDPILGDFPNIKFNNSPHLDMVQFIEQALLETRATTIFTHHPSDLNNDHLHTARACLTAARLHQRRPDAAAVQAVYYMEVLSATDWSFPGVATPFLADTFVSIEEHLALKIEALAEYTGVMRPPPHPRSEESIRALATYRGGQAGVRYAESFQTAFRLLDIRNLP